MTQTERMIEFKEKLANLLEEYNVEITAECSNFFEEEHWPVPLLCMNGYKIGIKSDCGYTYIQTISADTLRHSGEQYGILYENAGN